MDTPARGAWLTAAPMGLRSLALAAHARYSREHRLARGALFVERLRPGPDDRILDLGGGDGSHLAAIVPFRDNVTVADIDGALLARARERFGFRTATIPASGRLPFDDGAFDIVFCSSVIEHVTVDKAETAAWRSGRTFARVARNRQRRFAAEIRRLAPRYFVQTPARWFPIESHTLFPAPFTLLPRSAQLRIVATTNRWWIKPAELDWRLLDARELAALFPDATIERERSLGLTKSLMAIKA